MSAERDRTDPRGRIRFYQALLLSGLVLCLAVSGWVYVWMMGITFGGAGSLTLRLRPEAAADPLARIAAGRVGPAREVRIVQPPENVACAERESFDLWSQVERWIALVEGVGLRARLVAAGSLPRRAQRVDLVIAPWLLCLEEETRARLDRFVRSGGGLVIAGSLGARGIPGSDTNPGPLGAWTGATAVADFALRPERFAVASGRTAASAALDPGERLELPAGGRAVAARVPHPALLWSRWDLHPATGRDGSFWAAAAVGTAGRGRVAWLGFPATHRVEPGGARLDALRARALLWAAGDRFAAVAPWPGGARAAAVLALDVEGDRADAVDTARRLAERGARATLFFTSSWLEEEPSVAPLAARVGEIAAQADRRRDLAGQVQSRQHRRLHRARRALELLSGERVRGVHPPGERIDTATVHAAASAGFSYLLGDPELDRAYPRWLPTRRRSGLVLLSRAGAGDDFAYLVSERLSRPELLARFRADRERVHALGGLYVLSFRSDLLGRAELRGVLGLLVDDLRREGVWLATAGEVAAWFRARRALHLELDADSGALVLENLGPSPVRDVVVELYGDAASPRATGVDELAAGERRALPLSDTPALAVALHP